MSACSKTESQLTLFAEGSPARTSALQAKVRALPASALASGASSPALLARFDPATSLWKTSQLCLVEGLETFSETWPRSGMTRSGTAYRLPPLAPLTAETGFGSWPTPRANDAEKRGNFGPTNPRNGLPAAVRLWATPLARDCKGPGMSRAQRLQGRLPDNLSSQVRESDGSGALNPTWVEWLMGYPIGHTDCEDSETP